MLLVADVSLAFLQEQGWVGSKAKPGPAGATGWGGVGSVLGTQVSDFP